MVEHLELPFLMLNMARVGAVNVAGTTEDIPLERVQNPASVLKETATEISLRFQSGRVCNSWGKPWPLAALSREQRSEEWPNSS
jgi:hypothetical protein